MQPTSHADAEVRVNIGSVPAVDAPQASSHCAICQKAICECVRAQNTQLQRKMTRVVEAQLDTKALRDISQLATQTAAVVAVLVATVSYTALLSPPSGWTTLPAAHAHALAPTVAPSPEPAPGPDEWLNDVSAAAVSKASHDLVPFVVFSCFNFLSLLTSVFSLLLLLSLHLMQYNSVFNAHKDTNQDMRYRDLLTFTLVSAALGTLIFSIAITAMALGALLLFIGLLAFCIKYILGKRLRTYNYKKYRFFNTLRQRFSDPLPASKGVW
ncbi:hypothetical protein WJX81_000883 [Elliptochloris bilobata]|uniref:PGG domain-containing protein n=1 Tax=Elliptochloris bilobata TaxID=381761 RepID=A0AAW1S5I1_9CHLO